jgi:hypothetical protein
MAGELINRDSFLPNNPTDKQIYIDAYNNRWIYDIKYDLWVRSGASDELQLATASSPGYLSQRDKLLLDKVPSVGGAFGIIVDTKLLLQSGSNPEGVIQGDIKLKSDSINIICVSKDLQPLDNCKSPSTFNCEGTDLTTTGTSPGLKFELTEKFLKTLVINLRGQKGQKGVKGPKGPKGDTGYSIGPAGEQGDKGDSTTTQCSLTNVNYTDLTDITDTAVVKLDITQDCTLSLTKSKINLDPTLPATKVSASPILRTITYKTESEISKTNTDKQSGNTFLTRKPETTDTTSDTACTVTSLSDWTLNKIGTDPLPLNPTLLRLPKSDIDSSNAINFNAGITLSDFVTGMVDTYKNRLIDLDTKYLSDVKKYIDSIDAKARSILGGLAQQLAECEFNMPSVEYCITFNNCPIVGDSSTPPVPPPPTPPIPPIPPTPPPGPPTPPGPPISNFAASQKAGSKLNIDPSKQYLEINMNGKTWEINSQ